MMAVRALSSRVAAQVLKAAMVRRAHCCLQAGRARRGAVQQEGDRHESPPGPG